MSQPPVALSDSRFITGLVTGQPDLLREVPKSDLHNHCLLGIPLPVAEAISGSSIPSFRYSGNGIADINRWIRDHYAPALRDAPVISGLIAASFRQAAGDGVTTLEMSVDVGLGTLYGLPATGIVDMLRQGHLTEAPHICFRPSLGFSRSRPLSDLMRLLEPYLDLNYFTAIDLYDDEFSQPTATFRELFRMMKRLGYRCTAHAGEFGTAEDVREAVDLLELDAVQHGIAAASSPEVMRFLADRGIALNVCPTSNLILQRVASYATHPARILYDHGVRITINTDDITLFGQSVTDEYRNLFDAGLFSAEELNEIRGAWG